MLSLSDYLKEQLGRDSEEAILSSLFAFMTKEEQEECKIEPEFSIDLRKFRGDLFLPKGFKAMEAANPIMIEIKTTLTISAFNNQCRLGSAYIKGNQGHSYWVVYSDTRMVLQEDTEIEGVRILSLSYIKRKVNEYFKEHIVEIDASQQSCDTQCLRPTQEELIEKAVDALRYKPTTFILGAGVSVDAGAMGWDSLLKGIMRDVKHLNPIGQRNEDYECVNGKCGWSPLITARYIVDGTDVTKVVKSMRKNLYRHSIGPCIYNRTPTALPIIASLIKEAKSESAITFNYDNYLEEALHKEGVNRSSVYDKGSLDRNIFPVYHVHGLIGREKNNGTTITPVLSEREYHLLYSNDFHWSNVEILHALTRNSCFLIGLSMTDPNLRRLLDISMLDGDGEPRHFVLMRREPLNKYNPEKKYDEMHWRHLEDQFRSMGLNIIWFDYKANDPNDFTDLANKLEKIYNGLISLNN